MSRPKDVNYVLGLSYTKGSFSCGKLCSGIVVEVHEEFIFFYFQNDEVPGLAKIWYSI